MLVVKIPDTSRHEASLNRAVELTWQGERVAGFGSSKEESRVFGNDWQTVIAVPQHAFPNPSAHHVGRAAAAVVKMSDTSW